MKHDGPELAETIQTRGDLLVEELKGVRDAVEELYLLLDHVWRNREELYEMFGSRAERVEASESVSCVGCGAFANSLAEAVKDGWSALQHDEQEFVGLCQGCTTKTVDDERRKAPKRQKGLIYPK